MSLHQILTTDPEKLHEFHLTLDGESKRVLARARGDLMIWDDGFHFDYTGRRGFEDLCNAEEASVSLVQRNTDRPGDVSAFAGCLWARLESKKHADALSRFRRGPSLVVREGKSQRRWALWWLQQPLRTDVAARGNRAIAFTLGCVQKWGSEPEQAFVPCPGSTLGGKPVSVEFVALERRYRPGDFRGVVKRPPEKNTEWRRAA